MSHFRYVAVVVAALLGVAPLRAAGFTPGTLVVTAQSCPERAKLCPESITAYSPDGEILVRREQVNRPQNYFTELGFDLSGKLYFLDGVRVRILDESLEEEARLGGKRDLVQSISFDAQGNAYLGVFNFGRSSIKKYDSRGELLRQYKSRNPVYSSDLAADQCTLFYTSDARGSQVIRRYNVCSGVAMDDFAEVSGPKVMQLRALPDGGVLVATTAAVRRFDATGKEGMRYNVSGTAKPWRSIALTEDGTDFWGVISNAMIRFDLETGQTEAVLFAPDSDLTGIAVAGGWRPAANAPGRPAAPTDLRVEVVENGAKFNLTWKDNATDETEYLIEYRINFDHFMEVGRVSANRTSATVEGWKWARIYSFRVRAKNANGVSGYSNEAGSF